MAGRTTRVEPWDGWVASRPACHLRASAAPGVLLDAFVRAARGARLRVAVGAAEARAARGVRLGGLAAEVLQLPVAHLWARLEVRAAERAVVDEPQLRELRVVCVAGEREPGSATRVARLLDDAVARVERSGVAVDVLPWAAALDGAT